MSLFLADWTAPGAEQLMLARGELGEVSLKAGGFEAELKDAFERYAMPDFVDRDIAAATRAAPDWLTWNLLTLAIWRDEVLADAALAPLPGTRVLALSAGMGGR